MMLWMAKMTKPRTVTTMRSIPRLGMAGKRSAHEATVSREIMMVIALPARLRNGRKMMRATK
jgi:hypothetical protein